MRCNRCFPTATIPVSIPGINIYSPGMNQDEMWQHYLRRTEDAGASREPVLGAVPERSKSTKSK